MSGSDNGQKPDVPQPPQGLWLVCPVCKKINPAGTEFCKYCWGASLNSAEPMPYKAAAAYAQQLLQHKQHRRMTRIVLFVVMPLLLTAGAALLYIYSYTDLLWGPVTALISNSLSGASAMFRDNLSRTGSADNSTIQPQGELAWTFQTGGEIHSSPAVVNGVVYFGSQDNNFYAVDAATGVMRWEFKTGSYVNSSPAVVNGTVYFGSNDGYFYALDAVTGHELWAFKTRYGVESSPAVAGGKVYFGGDDGFVYCLNAVNGKKLWAFRTNGWVTSSPAVMNGLLYVGSSDGSLYVLNANDGRFRLNYNSSSSVFASPAVNNGEAYFTGQNDGILYGVNGKGRTWLWEGFIRPFWLEASVFNIAPSPPPVSGLPWGIGLFLDPNNPGAGRAVTATSTSIVTDNNIYTTGSNLVFCIDKTTHDFQWVFQAQDKITSSPALANNIIFTGSSGGSLYAIDAQSGAKLWDYATGGKIESSPTYAGGIIYTGSDDGKMYAIK